MKRIATVVLFLALAACSKKKDGDTGTGGVASNADMGSPPKGSAAPTDSADSGSGSGSAPTPAAAGSGSDTGSGSAAPAAAGSGSDAGSGSAVAAAGSGSDAAWDWEKLSHEDKAEYMKTKVVPAMKVEFQKFDPKHYENFGCKTCHGKDPKASKFKMPTPDLPKLDFAALKAGKQKPEVAKWMGEVVKPQMAKLLGKKEFDPAHADQGGFGCLECHEQKK